MINTEKIKLALPIEKLLEHYGGVKTSANQYWCIIHEKGGISSGHKTASLVVYPNSQTITCKSQGCFEGADIFGLIAKMEGWDIKSDYPAIIARAAAVAGVTLSKTKSFQDLGQRHLDYLKNRGLGEDIITELGLKSIYDHIVFPYENGYKAKTILPKAEWDNHRLKNPKWLPYFIKGTKPNFWSIGGLQNKKIIYLVAGEYDLAILRQEVKNKNLENEIGVITLVTGEGSPLKPNSIEYFKSLANAEWRIAYDYDEAGLKNMPVRAQELLRTGKRVAVFSWKPEMNPDNKPGYDINDHFLTNKNIDIFLDEANFSEANNELEPEPSNDAERIELISDPVALDNIYEAISKIGIISHDLVEICIATCISIGLKLELPIWLMIIGNPSSFKTEMIKLFRGIQEVLYLSSMSENAFASGYIPKDGSKPKDLLSILDDRILLIRDLTTMFSLNEETVKKILGDLTSIFDGEFEKFTATRGLMKYRATFPIIACITPAILAKHRNYMEQLGSRFLFFRIPHLTDENRTAGYNIAWNGERRSENIKAATVLVSSFCTQLINKVRNIELPKINKEAQGWLNNAAEFVSRARGKAITRQSNFTNEKGEEITFYELADRQVEEPWRALLQLRSLTIALAAIRERSVVTLDECETLRLLIQSSAPISRAEVMVALINEVGLTAEQISKKVDKSTKQVRRDLKELEALELTIKYKDESAVNVPWLYAIEPKYSALLAGGTIPPISGDETLDYGDADLEGGNKI